MLEWHAITSELYNSADDSIKTPDKIYFLTDTGEICRGTKKYTESIIFYNETLPTENIATGKLYINKTTLEGSVYDGVDWIIVTKDVESIVSNEITKVLTNAIWDDETHTLKIQRGNSKDNTIDIIMTGLATSLKYDAVTGALNLTDTSGNVIGNTINLDLERFVNSGEYDSENNKIKLYFNTEKTDFVEIPVPEIFKISATEGNAIITKDDGLYVAPVNLSSKQDKLTGTAGQMVGFDENGNAIPQPIPEGRGDAEKLKTARNIKTNLASTTAAAFDGSADINPGVTGILPVTNGGTGVSNLTGTDYTTSRCRGIALRSSTPSSIPNGRIVLVYS